MSPNIFIPDFWLYTSSVGLYTVQNLHSLNIALARAKKCGGYHCSTQLPLKCIQMDPSVFLSFRSLRRSEVYCFF